MLKNQNRTLAVLLLLVLLCMTLFGCSNGNAQPQEPQATAESAQAPETTDASEETAEPATEEAQKDDAEAVIRLGGLKGPTSIGMVKLLKDAQEGKTENAYTFKMAGSADELTPLLVKGDLDVLAVPVNLGSVLYQKTGGKVQLMAINTLGVVSLTEKGETVHGWQDLKGKTILATGKGSTPEYALKYLLTQNGLDPEKDVTIEWKSEPAEIVAQMTAQDGLVAMLPQPYVTVAQGQVEGLRIVMDLTEEWDKLDNGSQLLTAGLLVRTEFAQAHPDWIDRFLQDYAASTQFVNENVEEAAQLVEEFDIVKAAVAQKAIPGCHIVCIAGAEMQTKAAGYLEILHTYNPAAVGGTLPDEGFYYGT